MLWAEVIIKWAEITERWADITKGRPRSPWAEVTCIPFPYAAILQKWVPYSQQYLFNAIYDTNHNANPTNPNRIEGFRDTYLGGKLF